MSNANVCVNCILCALSPPPLPVGSRRLRMRVVITQLPLGTVELTQKAAG